MNAEPNKPGENPLQFERAEFAGQQALSCTFCKAPIASEYFQVNGQTICPRCRGEVNKFWSGGSGSIRLLKAGGAGIVAGIAGFLLYYTVLKVSNLDLGLIAIAVGWMVGTAVRWGSEARGGALYQLLAAGITYVAACAKHMPFILEGMNEGGGSVTVGKIIVAFIFSQVTPWLEGPSNIIGWIILGFAVYQAWILNKKAEVQVSGPFFTRQANPPAAS